MKNSVIFVSAFAAGAVSGAVSCYIFVKRRFQKRMDAEFETYKEEREELLTKHTNEMAAVLTELGRSAEETNKAMEDFAEALRTSPVYAENGNDIPYRIEAAEYGNQEEYKMESLVLYSDGIIADEADKPVDDLKSIIEDDELADFMSSFDEVIYTRNDATKQDFEIMKDGSSYEDYISGNDFLVSERFDE